MNMSSEQIVKSASDWIPDDKPAHLPLFNLFSAGTVFIRQNVTSVYVRF